MKHFGSCIGAALIAAAIPSAAQAAVTMSVSEVGGNVVVTTTGSLNTSGLEQQREYSFNLSAAVAANYAYLGTGTVGQTVYWFGPIDGPGALGAGEYFEANSGEGAAFAINMSFPAVFLTQDYVSGASLAGTATFLNQTLASLGLDAGTYTYTVPNDTITLNIGQAGVVPEPASWALMIGGIGAAGGALRRRPAKRPLAA